MIPEECEFYGSSISLGIRQRPVGSVMRIERNQRSTRVRLIVVFIDHDQPTSRFNVCVDSLDSTVSIVGVLDNYSD